MKKLAFEGATSFEMPSLKMVGLEKENENVVFAGDTPMTVYKGTSGGFSRSQVLRQALSDEGAGYFKTTDDGVLSSEIIVG